MGVQSTIAHFAGELERVRPLTNEETDMLCRSLRCSGDRRLWMAHEDRLLIRLHRQRVSAVEIGERMRRTAWSVRSRVRTLKRKGMGRG